MSAPPASLLCPTGCGTRSPRGPRGIACAQRDGVPVGSPCAQSNGDADPSLYCGLPTPRDGLSPVLGGPTPTPQPTLGPILLREAQCQLPPNPSPYGVPRGTHGCPTEPTGSSQPGPPPAHPGCLKTPPQPHLRCCAVTRASSAASSTMAPCNRMLPALRLRERRRQRLRGDKKGPSLHSPTPRDGPGEGLRVGTCVHVWACVRAHGYGHTLP